MIERWAIVEVFGHARHAGRVEEVTLAGVKLLRVHVPGWTRERVETRYAYAVELPDGPSGEVERDVHEAHEAHVVDLGGAAVFRIRWCTEEQARGAVQHCADLGEVTRTEGPWRRRGPPRLPPPPEDDLPSEEREIVDEVLDELADDAAHRPWRKARAHAAASGGEE